MKETKKAIKIGIVGVGNCASSLVQGLEFYKDKQPEEAIGLMHWEIGGYRPSDIEVVAAFDVDRRKVGKDVSEARTRTEVLHELSDRLAASRRELDGEALFAEVTCQRL